MQMPVTKKGKFISRMKPITPRNTNNIQISQVAPAAYLLHSQTYFNYKYPTVCDE